jgi:putative membrane protein
MHQESDMNTLSAKLTAMAVLWISLASAGAFAQTSSTGPSSGESAAARSSGDTRIADQDRKFVEKAAMGGIAEVELGKLAQQKATNDQVKQFGAHMAQDHSKANEELKQIAQTKGVTVPAAPDKSHQRDMDKLSKLSGAEFDRQYMSHMVADHRKTVAEFKKASESARDSEIKAFAGKTLPKLQEHLAQAQSINDSVKSASR